MWVMNREPFTAKTKSSGVSRAQAGIDRGAETE